jgi:hypothetical protein
MVLRAPNVTLLGTAQIDTRGWINGELVPTRLGVVVADGLLPVENVVRGAGVFCNNVTGPYPLH